MILADKLYKLRTNCGLSQEEVAEKMNVSRQSVSKWESGNSIPGLDKIVDLAKLYNVSTDYLLLDEIEELPEDVVVDTYEGFTAKEVTLEEANIYINQIKESSKKIALGVLLCILSPVPLMVLLGMSDNNFSQDIAGGIGVACLLVMIALAVAIFILNGAKLDDYEYLEKEDFSLGYGVAGVVKKKKEQFLPEHHRYVAIGVVLCVIAAVPLIVAAGFSEKDSIALYMIAVLLLLVAFGVYLMVMAGCEKDAYDKLLQEGDFTKEKKYKNKKLEGFSGAYWGIVTAVYLGISFLFNNWDISWVIWPVAGVLFAGIYSLLGTFVKTE